MNNTVAEYCPYCEGEAELESKFVPQKCDICGHELLPCAQCHQLHSVFGCKKCPFEIENVVKISKFVSDEVGEAGETLEEFDGDFNDFYDKVNEYKEKYKVEEKDIERFSLIANTVLKEIYTHKCYEFTINDFVISISISPKEEKYE